MALTPGGPEPKVGSRWWLAVRTRWADLEWPVITVLFVLGLTLGFVGIAEHHRDHGLARGVFDVLYVDVQLMAMQFDGSIGHPGYPWSLDVARVMLPALAFYTGLRALVVVFRERFEAVLARFARDHAVIVGLGATGMAVARSLRAERWRVVAIERDVDEDVLRAAQGAGISVLRGDARHPEILRRARVDRAAHLLVFTGDDGVNATVAESVGSMVAGSDRVTNCLALIGDPDLCRLLRSREMASGDGHGGGLRLDFVNLAEAGATTLLTRHPPFEPSAPAARIAVVGTDRLGQSIIVQSGRNWRAAGSDPAALELVVAGPNATQTVEALSVRYPELSSACRVEPVDAAYDSPALVQAVLGPPYADRTYVTLPDDSDALSVALTLHHRLTGTGAHVIVPTAADSGLASLVGADREEYQSLVATGLLELTLAPDVLLGGVYERLARAVHEAYVAGERAQGVSAEDNPSTVPWDQLPAALKESNRDQAAHIGVKLDAVDCRLEPMDGLGLRFAFAPEEVERLAELEHERWVRDRERNGWVAGPVKDADAKVTPYLVPYDDLTDEVKQYDRDTIVRLPTFLAGLGYQIARKAAR